MAERGNGAGRDDGFLADVLAGIGAPVNLVNLTLLRAWQRSEGSSASWNPFNTLQNGYGGTSYRGTAVKNYPSRAKGLAATIHTLQLPSYAKVRKALANSNPIAALNAIVQSPWAKGHYDAHKTKGGGYDYRTSNFWKVYRGLVANTPTAATPTTAPDGGVATPTPAQIANAPTTPPIGLVSGDGTFGTVIYDPIEAAIVVGLKVYKPFTLWISATPAEQRKKYRILVDPGAVSKLGARAQYITAAGTASVNGDSPGWLDSVWPDNLTGEGSLGDNITPDDLTPDINVPGLEAVGNAFAWATGNLGRIGLGALGILVIVAAVLWANKGNIPKVVPIPI